MKLFNIHNIYLLGLLLIVIVILIVLYFELKAVQANIKELNKPLNSPSVPAMTNQNIQPLDSVDFVDLGKLDDLESNTDNVVANNVLPQQATVEATVFNNSNDTNLKQEESDDTDEDEDLSEELSSDMSDGGEDEESNGISSNNSLGEDIVSIGDNTSDAETKNKPDDEAVIEQSNLETNSDGSDLDEDTQIALEKKRILSMNNIKELKRIAQQYKIIQKGTKEELVDRIVNNAHFDIKKYIEDQVK